MLLPEGCFFRPSGPLPAPASGVLSSLLSSLPLRRCRAAEAAEEAQLLGYSVCEGDRGEALVYRCGQGGAGADLAVQCLPVGTCRMQQKVAFLGV